MISTQPVRLVVAVIVGTLMTVGVCAGQETAGAGFRARGLEHGYNLDYPEALAAFEQAIAADPNDATAHRLAAAAIWMRMLFLQGAVTVEDYLGQARASVTRPAPPPDLAAAFRLHLDRAAALADQQVRANPADPDAHFQVGAASGFRASFIATIDGRVVDSVGAARRAYSEHKRCLTLDPERKDAGLIIGLYRYGVASLSLPMRLMARLAGFDGGRATGLRLVEDAAHYPSYVQPNAMFTLVLLYNREGRHAEALRMIKQLQERYPRNRLLRLEEGSTALRAGLAAESLQALDTGLAQLAADPRPRAYGEDARWHYQRGAALVALRQADAAARALNAALAADAPAWVHGRTHVELGKLATLARDRSRAAAEFRRALDQCRAGHDSTCADEAKRLMREGSS